MPGSIGSGGVQRVFKGTRMGGRMGTDTQTTQNLELVGIDNERNVVLIRGAIPGPTNGYVLARCPPSRKSTRSAAPVRAAPKHATSRPV